MNNIALKIISIRESMHLTQEEFADFCGLSRSSVARYELGGKPNRASLEKMAAALNTTVSALLGEEAPTRPVIRDEDIRFALSDGDEPITDEQFEEVKKFVSFIRSRDANK